jgi:hypothetical protein
MLKRIIKYILTLGENTEVILSLFRGENAKPLNNKKKNLHIHKITEHYLGSNIYSFGKKNKKKKFYIINRSPGAGFFSNVNFVLNQLLICKKSKYTPIIDMENYKTIYNENKKIFNTYNAWEYYFNKLNKYKLIDVYKSKNVIINPINEKIKFEMSDKILNHFKNKIIPHIKFQSLADRFIKKKFNKNDKILGIHLRGTSYKTAVGHAFPPTPKIMSEFIDKLMNEYKYNKIFLVTEEAKYLDFFKNKYKNKCYYLNSFRSKSNDAFKIYPRKLHRYKLGAETLVESLVLSKCNGLAYVKSNLIAAAIFFSKIKQNKHEIFLGLNSRNKFTARWIWYLKSILPKYFGGLKIIKS